MHGALRRLAVECSKKRGVKKAYDSILTRGYAGQDLAPAQTALQQEVGFSRAQVIFRARRQVLSMIHAVY